MRQVYAPANAVEGHMLVHMLREQGIEAQLQGEALQSGVGKLPAANFLHIAVADEDYERARELVLAWERLDAAGEPITPARFRFPTLIALAFLAAGVLLGWLAKSYVNLDAVRIGESTVEFDQNEDGTVDATYFYRGRAAYAHRAELDNNFDGRADLTVYYNDVGTAVREAGDLNFDGYQEYSGTYEAGVLARTQIDIDRDGASDIVSHYRSGVLRRVETFDPRRRTRVRVDSYENFRLARSESDLDRDGVLETIRIYDPFGEIVRTETRDAAP
jgi:hypothetical protein